MSVVKLDETLFACMERLNDLNMLMLLFSLPFGISSTLMWQWPLSKSPLSHYYTSLSPFSPPRFSHFQTPTLTKTPKTASFHLRNYGALRRTMPKIPPFNRPSIGLAIQVEQIAGPFNKEDLAMTLLIFSIRRRMLLMTTFSSMAFLMIAVTSIVTPPLLPGTLVCLHFLFCFDIFGDLQFDVLWGEIWSWNDFFFFFEFQVMITANSPPGNSHAMQFFLTFDF